MNFKDAYKNMNDEIHGDRALLHAILNGEAKKTKKFTFNSRPVFATVLAAAFVLCIATVYNNTGIEQYSPSGNASQTDTLTQKAYEELTIKEKESGIADKKDVKINDTVEKSVVSDNPQKNAGEAEISKHVEINNQKTGQIGEIAQNQEINDEQNIGDEGNMPLAASLNEAQLPQTEAAYSVDDHEIAEYDAFAPSVAKSNDSFVEAFDGEAQKSRVAASGGGSSAFFDSVLNADIPSDMSFGDGVRNGDSTVTYVAVSGDNPERRVSIVVSETDNLKEMYPGATHIQMQNCSACVIAENLTAEEINRIINSLNG